MSFYCFLVPGQHIPEMTVPSPKQFLELKPFRMKDICPATLIDSILSSSVTKRGKPGLDFFPFTLSHSKIKDFIPQRKKPAKEVDDVRVERQKERRGWGEVNISNMFSNFTYFQRFKFF